MTSRAHSSDFHSRIRAQIVSESFGIHAPHDFRFSGVSGSMVSMSKSGTTQGDITMSEPTYVGAVTIDSEGDLWTRQPDGRWSHPSGMKWAWEPIIETFGPMQSVI